MREEGSRPGGAARRRPLTARTATVTAGGQLIARATTLLVTVGGTAVVTRAIGVDGFADWGTVLMLTAMFAFLLDPGLAPVVVRRLAEGGAEAPSPAALLVVRVGLSCAAFAMVLVLTLILRGSAALVVGIALSAQLLPRAIVMNVGTWMQAEHRLHVQTALEALTMAVGLAGLIVAATLDAPAAVLATVGVLLPAVALALLMQGELRRVPHASGREPGRERELVRAVLREAAPLAGAIVLVSLYTRIGVVFVNEADRGGSVADFTFAFLFIEQAFVAGAIVAATLLPMLAERGVGAPRDRLPIAADMLAFVTFVGAAGALALVASARPLVLVIGGGDLDGAIEILTLLAPACAALFANLYMGYLHVAARQASRYLIFNLFGLAVSVGLGLALTLDEGAVAAARVTWITETLVVVVAAISFFRGSGGEAATLLHLVVPLAVVIACSELVVANSLAPVAAAAIGAAVVLALSGLRVRRWRGYARLGLLSRVR